MQASEVQYQQKFPAVQLESSDGAQLVVGLMGGHVLSWQPRPGDERLFLSAAAEAGSGSATRGGVPVIFPQFAGYGPLPKHGFARTETWAFLGLREAQARFVLNSPPAGYELWPHPFSLFLELRFDAQHLQMTLRAQNTGRQPYEFTAALHSYLRVQDVAQVSVEGLEGRPYLDAAAGGIERQQDAAPLRIEGEVDRIYWQVTQPLTLRDGDRALRVSAAGFPDVVVWNPGPEKSAALADMEAGGYQRMLCIEAALIGQPQRLAPGESWAGSQVLELLG